MKTLALAALMSFAAAPAFAIASDLIFGGRDAGMLTDSRAHRINALKLRICSLEDKKLRVSGELDMTIKLLQFNLNVVGNGDQIRDAIGFGKYYPTAAEEVAAIRMMDRRKLSDAQKKARPFIDYFSRALGEAAETRAVLDEVAAQLREARAELDIVQRSAY